MTYFACLTAPESPRTELENLQQFVHTSRRFLTDLLKNDLKLPHSKPERTPVVFDALHKDALSVFEAYIDQPLADLPASLAKLDRETLHTYGLAGEDQKQKWRALVALETNSDGPATYWATSAAMLAQVDDLLDSIFRPLEASFPESSAPIRRVKEFKATLRNIVE